MACQSMIRSFRDTQTESFRDAQTETLFNDRRVSRFRAIERVARRKFLLLHQALRLEDLRVPPVNRLEALRGERKGQYSIRINDQWRICLRWTDGDAFDVEIIDYH
jgi:toxin HigB-1